MLIECISGLTLQSFHSHVGRLRDSYMPALSRAILALYVSISSPSLRWFSFFFLGEIRPWVLTVWAKVFQQRAVFCWNDSR